MKILLTFDTNYAPHAATVMESIIRNCPEKLEFVVIYFNLNQETQDILTKHFAEKVKGLEFIQLDAERLVKNVPESVQNCEHITIDMYLRIFAAELLPNDDHVIYLDCDIIVKDNILKIIEGADLSKPVCATSDYDPAYKLNDLSNRTTKIPFRTLWIVEAFYYRTYSDLQMDETAKYFCSAVMILNLSYWRQHKIAEKVMRFIAENPEKLVAPDQDAMNTVLNGNYFSLDIRWCFLPPRIAIHQNYPEKMMTDAEKNPAIIHIGGAKKPWTYMCHSRYQKMYKAYRRYTPWPKVEYSDKTVGKMILKYGFEIVEKIIGTKNIELLKTYLPHREKRWLSKVAKTRIKQSQQA